MNEVAAQVRAAGLADWEALKRIRLEALFDAPEAFSTTFVMAMAWSDARWHQLVQDGPCFLAERDSEVVGMVRGGRNEAYPDTAWMYGMFVAAHVRGSGAAEQLVDAISDWARAQGFGELFLHVGASVTRARAFYERVGFSATGDTTTFERNPSETLLTMVRGLD